MVMTNGEQNGLPLASSPRRDFHAITAGACLRLQPLRFCGLHARTDRFSGCVLVRSCLLCASCRAAVALALRGKARRTDVWADGGAPAYGDH